MQYYGSWFFFSQRLFITLLVIWKKKNCILLFISVKCDLIQQMKTLRGDNNIRGWILSVYMRCTFLVCAYKSKDLVIKMYGVFLDYQRAGVSFSTILVLCYNQMSVYFWFVLSVGFICTFTFVALACIFLIWAWILGIYFTNGISYCEVWLDQYLFCLG